MVQIGEQVPFRDFSTPQPIDVTSSGDSSSQQTNAIGLPKATKDVLRYPSNRIEKENSDFLKIRILRYRKATEDLFSGLNLSSAEERIGVPKKDQIVATILLPIPQSIQDSNGVKWGEDSLNPLASSGLGIVIDTLEAGKIQEAMENAVTGGLGLVNQLTNTGRNLSNLFFGSKIINALGGNTSFQGLIARTTGNVLNPNLELLFNGVTLRSFSFDFDLSPRHTGEAEEIRLIIRELKKNMSAKGGRLGTVDSGFFIESPNIFEITYQTGNGKHQYLNQFKPMALLNMSVNYTGSGTYATYEDTSPVHYKMNLQFQELDPIYAEDYEIGKGALGVGY